MKKLLVIFTFLITNIYSQEITEQQKKFKSQWVTSFIETEDKQYPQYLNCSKEKNYYDESRFIVEIIKEKERNLKYKTKLENRIQEFTREIENQIITQMMDTNTTRLKSDEIRMKTNQITKRYRNKLNYHLRIHNYTLDRQISEHLLRKKCMKQFLKKASYKNQNKLINNQDVFTDNEQLILHEGERRIENFIASVAYSYQGQLIDIETDKSLGVYDIDKLTYPLLDQSEYVFEQLKTKTIQFKEENKIFKDQDDEEKVREHFSTEERIILGCVYEDCNEECKTEIQHCKVKGFNPWNLNN